mgnify:CR=1 FL=1
MKLADLIRNPVDGNMSVVKVVTLVAVWTLHTALYIQAYKRDLDASDYVGFALAIAIVSGMPIANHFVNAIAKFRGYAVPTPAPAPGGTGEPGA